jgi:hypothetical protein
VSHDALLALAKLSVPPPVFVIPTDAAAGLIPLPCVALNDRVLVERDNTGGGGVTVNVTAIVAGEPCAPDAVTVTSPLYVPATSVPNAAEICNVFAAVPLVGLTVSQDALLAAAKLSVLPPVFVRLTDAAAGFFPLPCTALNATEDVESERTGGGGATVNVAVIFAGEPWAPPAVIVTCPVYVPAFSVPRIAEICRTCGAVPLPGVIVSQVESLAAVKVTAPVPVLLTLMEAAAGFVPLPWVAPNETDDCERERMGPAVLALA